MNKKALLLLVILIVSVIVGCSKVTGQEDSETSVSIMQSEVMEDELIPSDSDKDVVDEGASEVIGKVEEIKDNIKMTTDVENGTVDEVEGAIVGYKYTVDGTDPNTNGIDYTEPFDVSEKCSIKAIAISSSGANSVVTSFEADAGYFISLPSPAFSSSLRSFSGR